MIGELLLLSLFDMLAVQWIKRFIKQKWLIHVVVLAIAIVIALLAWGWNYLPTSVAVAVGVIWVSAVGLYDILIKRVFGGIKNLTSKK